MYNRSFIKIKNDMRFILLVMCCCWSMIGLAQQIASFGAGDSLCMFNQLDNYYGVSRGGLGAIHNLDPVRAGMIDAERHTKLAHLSAHKNVHHIMKIRHQRLLQEFVLQQATFIDIGIIR